MGARHGPRPASRRGRSWGRGARARPEPRAAGAGGGGGRPWATLRARAGCEPGRRGRRRGLSPRGQVRGSGSGDLRPSSSGSARSSPARPGGGWARGGQVRGLPPCTPRSAGASSPGHPGVHSGLGTAVSPEGGLRGCTAQPPRLDSRPSSRLLIMTRGSRGGSTGSCSLGLGLVTLWAGSQQVSKGADGPRAPSACTGRSPARGMFTPVTWTKTRKPDFEVSRT